MADQITYIDGLGRVRIANNLVHFELVSAFPTTDDQKVELKAVHNIAMTIPQFVKLAGDMSKNLEEMQSRGILKKESSE